MDLAVRVVRMVEGLPRKLMTRHISQQLLRAATAGGANYQEARHAESRADFIHKVRVAAKETSETLYWLQLLERLGVSDLGPLMREADELVAILVASANTARANS
ncbi:MAG: four helix bundle protein [Labilithrix sp.]|nr:four helix bundle protein [Labilithrix sp.]